MEYELGMIGIGVMGRNLLLNMADHGYSGVGFARSRDKVDWLLEEGKGKPINGTNDYKELLGMLKKPRVFVLLVPAGKPVDDVIENLLPMIDSGDLIIDAGNSFYRDTERRYRELGEKKVNFFGMGVSGGESGARYGPSIMPGGPTDAYERIKPVLEAISAKVNGEPCVTYLGKGSAGHYVKMVHNGIEYGQMQLLAETYDLMHNGAGVSNDELADIYTEWNDNELGSFLVEITAKIFRKKDDRTSKHLLDVISDVARSKGTGRWTSQDAMDLASPIPVIDVAVSMRQLSGKDEQRRAAAKVYGGEPGTISGDKDAFVADVRKAYYAGMIISYAQGLAQIRAASDEYGYGVDLEDAARIWRGGCIIRSKLLEDFRAAYSKNRDLPNILLDDDLAAKVKDSVPGLRAVVKAAVDAGIAVPGFMATLGYFDAYRRERLPTNLTQAQRDFFGAHTYERTDDGAGKFFHTEWEA